MNYRIIATKIIPTKTGTKMAKAIVSDEQAKEYENTTLFDPYADYAVGAVLVGSLVPNDYNGKIGWKFQPEVTNTLNRPKANTAAITKAMETKAQNIEKAQDNKERSIKIASTMSKAVELAIAESNRMNPVQNGLSIFDFEGRITYWRTWLFKHWDDEQAPF